MRRLRFLSALLLFAVSAFGDNKLTENFESGLPTSASSSETVVTLASGQWKIKGACGKNDNSSLRLAMSSNGYAVTPTLCQPGKVTFSHRASGSGKKLMQRAVQGHARDIGPYESSYSAAAAITTVKDSPAVAPCKKVMRNARIVIEKEGHHYNTKGQQIAP